jgi:hypothetical protein
MVACMETVLASSSKDEEKDSSFLLELTLRPFTKRLLFAKCFYVVIVDKQKKFIPFLNF